MVRLRWTKHELHLREKVIASLTSASCSADNCHCNKKNQYPSPGPRVISSFFLFCKCSFSSVSPTLENLPAELLHQILVHVPRSSLTECRLVCRSFSTVAFPVLFSFVPNWLDYELSHRSIVSLAHDAFNRPAVMWSPWATARDGAH